MDGINTPGVLLATVSMTRAGQKLIGKEQDTRIVEPVREEDVPGRLRLTPVRESGGHDRPERVLSLGNASEIKDAYSVTTVRGDDAQTDWRRNHVSCPEAGVFIVLDLPALFGVEKNYNP